MSTTATPIAAISLFAGAGGDTLGLERAGAQVVAFSEMNKAAVATHLANFPASVHLKGSGAKGADITQIPGGVFEPYAGKTDIVFAGFPCQGVSKAGKKKADDPRNQMYLQFVRVVRATRPRFIIGENVPGLLSMKSPKGEDALLLDDIRAAFGEIGYELTHKVLEATDYGVPQKRKRLLIIGWRREEPLDVASFWAAVAAWGAAQPLRKLREFVAPSLEGAYLLKEDEVPDDFDGVALEVGAGAAVSGTPHPFVALKAGQKLLSCSKRASPVHSEVIDVDRPSKTIICTYDHQPRLLVGLRRGTERWVRALLPDELKQIQGFPASFELTGNQKERVVQVGNAVPPALVEAVARQLVALLGAGGAGGGQ
jgi:DNA (cytosine-5)-methyltransferase 1